MLDKFVSEGIIFLKDTRKKIYQKLHSLLISQHIKSFFGKKI